MTGPDKGPSEAPMADDSSLNDTIGQVMRRLLSRGREELGKAADRGRTRLELRQLRSDRDHFWIRLGKTAYRLVESGEIDHPALHKAIGRIDELEDRIRALEAEQKALPADAE